MFVCAVWIRSSAQFPKAAPLALKSRFGKQLHRPSSLGIKGRFAGFNRDQKVRLAPGRPTGGALAPNLRPWPSSAAAAALLSRLPAFILGLGITFSCLLCDHTSKRIQLSKLEQNTLLQCTNTKGANNSIGTKELKKSSVERSLLQGVLSTYKLDRGMHASLILLGLLATVGKASTGCLFVCTAVKLSATRHFVS